MKIKNLIALAVLFVMATSASLTVKSTIVKDANIDLVTNKTFVEFLSHFEKRDLPFNIGLNDLEGNRDVVKDKPDSPKPVHKVIKTSALSESDFMPEARFGRMKKN